MRLALNGATTMRADLETDIRAAAEAGFDGVEIWAAKLKDFLRTEKTTRLKELLDQHKIEAYSINSIERITFRDREGRAALRAECEELCRVASEIGCPYIVVVPSPLPEGSGREAVINESVAVLEEMGNLAAGYGVGLAFEFLGQPRCSVQTLELAAEIVTRVARPNVGLVLDSFHFYAGGSTIDSIEKLDASRLFVFHINDAEDLPRERLEDRHRLLPGLGILPLAEITGALERISYDRVTSVEIFRPEYWERDPFELARAAHAAVSRVLGKKEIPEPETHG